MEITTAMLILIISAVVGLGGNYVIKQSKTRKMVFNIAMISVVAMIVAIVMANNLPEVLQFLNTPTFGQTFTVPGTDTTVTLAGGQATTSGGGICAVEDTTVTLSAINKFTSVATGGTHRYRVNGAPALTVSDAGTFAASPGDSLEILWNNGSETNTAYYSAVSKELIPCAGTKTFSSEVVSNGTLTIEVFNEEGNLIVDASENETLGAGDVVTLSARMKGTFQTGHPYGGVIVAMYNNSAYDDVIVDFGGSKVSTPQFYTVTGTAYTTKSYSVPAILSTEIIPGTITIDVDDVDNPGGQDSAINLTFYSNDYFVNEDLGGAFEGPAVQDEDDAQTKEYTVVSNIAVD